ncbi:winged helix DNA-binding domain-containing protein [Dactylosporangium sp. CA-233914]|uniref:winged helix DNA-binding domain-containing protein n=1 Tax=Dactylosporangium sp. CA-233914 TaxID=3239934 RepID=UPI003D8A4D69
MSGAPVLSWRALNRALLARQLLLERAPITAPEALTRMGGLQAQYAPSMYIGLWTRVADLERESLTRMLHDRAVVQATLLRGTIHLVSRSDYWTFAAGGRTVRHEPVEAVLRLRDLLRERPVRRTELDEIVGPDLRRVVYEHLDLVRVPPSGTWARRRADLFGLAEDWVGPPDVEPGAARERLVRRYLAAFGPAHRREIADWAGLPPAAVAPVLARLDLRTFRDERGRELLDVPDGVLPEPDTPAPVRFLPTWDAVLLVHARRALILPEEHRSKIFHVRMPQSIGTFLLDGQVAGTWVWRDGRVAWEPFAPLPARARRAVDAEAERLGAFHV